MRRFAFNQQRGDLAMAMGCMEVAQGAEADAVSGGFVVHAAHGRSLMRRDA